MPLLFKLYYKKYYILFDEGRKNNEICKLGKQRRNEKKFKGG